MVSKDDIIADQARQIVDLTQRVSDLELQLAKALKNSSNSSKAPSSDIVKPKKKSDGRTKAKRGGQKGHKRKLREPLPPERVDELVTHELTAADVRESGLTPTDDFEIVQ